MKRTPELTFRPDRSVRSGSASTRSCATCPRPTRSTQAGRRHDPAGPRGDDRLSPGRSRGPTGVAIVDKAAGWTSHDVVAKSRGILGTRKVGHSGTLDPDATGVLVLGVGRVTRLLRFLTALPQVLRRRDRARHRDVDARRRRRGRRHPRHGRRGDDEVRAAAADLTGDILQVPPMVSARQGRRPAPPRAGPRRARRSSASPDRSPSTGSTVAAGARGTRRVPGRGRLLVGHLHPARWPPTSATRSGAAPTCATCGAPPSGRSTGRGPARSRRSSCWRPARRCVTTRRWSSTVSGSTTCATAGCCPPRGSPAPVRCGRCSTVRARSWRCTNRIGRVR